MVLRIIIIVFLFLVSNLHAEPTWLHIITRSGITIRTDITEMPKIAFENGIMSIGTEQIQVDNIVKYVINRDGANTVENFGGEFVNLHEASKGVIRLTNGTKQDIHLYNINGMSVPFKMTNNGKTTTIDFSTQSAGIYLLTIGNQTIKCKKQ